MDRLKRFINRILDEAIKEIKSLRQSLMNAVQNAECREEELGKEIEQLKKEKEWLIEEWTKDKYYIDNLWAVGQHSIDKYKDIIKYKMQQALKEKIK